MPENQIDCFVIMPFSQTTPEHTEEYWNDHYNVFLKPLIEKNPNIIAHRSAPLRGDILKQIINDLVVSPIVVADLTDKNANVFWELGVRQSFMHGTITIAEYGPLLPFDIGGKGTLFYHPKNHIKMKDFTTQFEEAIKDCLLHPDRPDSHVLESISGRGTMFEIFNREEALRRLDAVLSECNKNLDTLKWITNQAQTNLRDNKKIVIPVDQFRSVAIELLLTNRYVREDKTFYESAEECWDRIAALNGNLIIWGNSLDFSNEKFIIETEKETKKIIEDFKAKVEQAHDKMSRLF